MSARLILHVAAPRACSDDLYASARKRGAPGSRWSARSDARTNDLEAGCLAAQNCSGCQWRLLDAGGGHQDLSLSEMVVVAGSAAEAFSPRGRSLPMA